MYVLRSNSTVTYNINDLITVTSRFTIVFIITPVANIELKTAEMSAPTENEMLRPVNRAHIIQLKTKLCQWPGLKTNAIILNIPSTNKDEVDMEKLLAGGTYKLETVGGNHRRVALQELTSQTETSQIEEFWTWPVRVYAGLTDGEVQALGFTDNAKDSTQLPMTFDDMVRLFRKELAKFHDLAITPVPDASVTQWKQHLMRIMGVKVGILLLIITIN
jgi:hypothetical protein